MCRLLLEEKGLRSISLGLGSLEWEALVRGGFYFSFLSSWGDLSFLIFLMRAVTWLYLTLSSSGAYEILVALRMIFLRSLPK